MSCMLVKIKRGRLYLILFLSDLLDQQNISVWPSNIVRQPIILTSLLGTYMKGKLLRNSFISVRL